MTDDLFESVCNHLSWKQVVKKDQKRSDYAYCEIHGDSDTPDLRIYEDGNWKCHACGATGQDIIRYVARRDNCNDYEAATQLIDDHSLPIDTEETEAAKEERRERQRIRRIQDQVVQAAQTNLPPARRQTLKETRNWTDETIDDRRIGWMDDDLFNTLQQRHGDDLETAGVHYGMTGDEDGAYVIPHLKRNGAPYLITTRDPSKSGDDPAKYMQSKNTDYVENDIYIICEHRSDRLIITEGYPDAISAYQAGFDVVAAGCGSFEGEHDRIADIATNYDEVVLVTDNDATGETNLHDTAQSLAVEANVTIVNWPDDTPEKYDLDDWTTENGEELTPLFESATDYLDLLIDRMESSDRKTRAAAKNNLFTIIQEWSRGKQDEVLRDVPGNFEVNRSALDEFIQGVGTAPSTRSEIDWNELEELYLDEDLTKIVANNATAQQLLERFEFRTLRDTEEIWQFQDPIYEPGGEQFLRQLLHSNLGQYMRKKDTNEILEKVRTQTFIDRPEPDEYSHLIALENGVYNVKTKELEPGNPDYFLVNKCPVKYDEDADCPNIEQFLQDIVREEDVQALQEMVGYALLADQPYEKAWMLLGSGENGKSTFLNLVTRLLGEENVVSPSLHRIMNSSDSLATLYGKLANINADLSAKGLQNTGIFKQLTGGDKIQADEKYKPSFEFTNTATLIYAANKLPDTHDTTDAFFRRWIIIEFPYKFTNHDDDHKNKDPQIAEKLYQDKELSGFFNFAVTGLHRVLENNGFSDTRHMEDIKEEWLRRTNPLMAFTEHHTTSDQDCVVPKSEFADAVREFCRDKGAAFPSNKEIGENLPGMVDAVSTVRPTLNGDRPNCWEGLRVTGEYSNQIDQYERDGAGYRLITHDGAVESGEEDENTDPDNDDDDASSSNGSNVSSGTTDSPSGSNDQGGKGGSSQGDSNKNVNRVKANSDLSARAHARGDAEKIESVENCLDIPDISDTIDEEQHLPLSDNTLLEVISRLTDGNERDFVTIDELAQVFDSPREVIEYTVESLEGDGELYNPKGEGYRRP